MTLTPEHLAKIIDEHGKWMRGEVGGTCADLRSANLRDANLSSANLRGANLSCANLSSADLSSANFTRRRLVRRRLFRLHRPVANPALAHGAQERGERGMSRQDRFLGAMVVASMLLLLAAVALTTWRDRDVAEARR